MSLSQSPPPLFKQGSSITINFVICLILSMTLIVLDLNLNFITKIRSTFFSITRPVIEILLLPRDAFVSLSEHASTVLSLNRKINKLEDDLRINAKIMLKIQQLEDENKELRTLLGLQVKLDPSFVNAEIRYELPDIYTDKVVINKGESDELAVGYPVITARGILGQLSRVYNTSAELTLVSDSSVSVPVSLPASEVIGITKGQGNRATFELQYADISANIKVGDEVITSGLGGVYPPGIMVGHVISVSPAKAGQFPKIVGRVASSAGLQHQVMVLLKEKMEDGTE
ncbi:rod shape-determining protein MreC [Betaproteobacteria bacterium]|nr:rod shape-determining protein MreC [Betaproteobacteria bacterium]